MLKNISNLGSVLNKAEQKIINGGTNCYNIWDYCDKYTWRSFDYCMITLGCGPDSDLN